MTRTVLPGTSPLGSPLPTIQAMPTPDWRHAWAVDSVSRGRYVTKKSNDPLTIRYVEFLRRSLRYTSSRGLRLLVRRFPDLCLAQKVAQEFSLRPWELHARALAGQSDRAIARAVGLPVPTVAAYLGLFFDVRHKLHAGSWIRWVVLGLSPDQPPSVQSLALWHCWRRGPSVVGPWLDYLQHLTESHDLATELGRQRAAIQLLVEIRQLPETPEIRESLAKKFAYIRHYLEEIPKTVSLAGGIAHHEAQILRDIAWKEAQNEVLFGDEQRWPKSSTTLEPEFRGYTKAG